jgi:uncharacterized protein (TIGR03118 family)
LRLAKCTCFLILALLLLTSVAAAQTTLGFRQINLACHVQCSPNKPASLLDPWGIAFLPGQNFLIAEHGAGRVDSFDATGALATGFAVPLPAGSTATISRPTGIVADPDASIHLGVTHFHFFVATEEGTIVAFNMANGQFQDVQVLVDRTQAAEFTGMALLHPSCCNPMLAVANFAAGEVEVFSPSLTALPGGFDDPNLPAGYSPFNVQSVGDQVFVTYAMKDDTGREALKGEGLGIVSVFDQDGNFIRRFASEGGSLNAPWGVTRSSANFGPFPNDLLVGNAGNGQVEIFDPATAAHLGTLTDSEGFVFFNDAIRALIFRGTRAADGVGDADDLYFAARSTIGSANDGLFGAIEVGRLSSIVLTAPNPVLIGTDATFTAEVQPVAGGDQATGSVLFIDIPFTGELGTVPLTGAIATLHHTFTTAGNHSIFAVYQGTDNLLPSLANKVITVLGPTTTTTLTASQTSVAAGEAITFTAHSQSAGGVPTGSVAFTEGTTVLSIVDVDGNGTATFTARLLSGSHSIFAKLLSNDFQSSSSTPILVTVGGDFQVTPSVPSVTISAGQSADVTLTVGVSNGFNGTVNFNCVAPAGIRCSFNPQVLDVSGQAETTKLTVSGSTLARESNRTGLAMLGLGMFGTMLVGGRAIGKKAAMMLVAMFLIGGCVACGSYGSKSSPTPRTSSVTVSATAGSITHQTSLMVTMQ